ncbi:MAG: hypothetical protein H6Q06_1151 [Acidobacteria bacterium]|nr:hypothetical protein [Acidobacteriota bacterium]
MLNARAGFSFSIFSRMEAADFVSIRLISSATARMPPYDSRLKSPRDLSFCSRMVVILLMISGEICSRPAMRITMSARRGAGSELRSAAAWEEFRCARTSAMVCGCSDAMNLDSCAGSAFCRLSKPTRVFCSEMFRRSSSFLDASPPNALTSSLFANSAPPRATSVCAVVMRWNSSSTVSATSGSIFPRREISRLISWTSSSCKYRKTPALASSPSNTVRIAAFLIPATGSSNTVYALS